MAGDFQLTERFPPSALVLDMDGLMVDSEPLWFQVERAFAASRGGDWTAAHAHACIGRGFRETLRTMHEVCGFAVDEERDMGVIVDAFMDRLGDLQLKPGCRELCEAARAEGMPLAVASSSALRLIHAVVDRTDLARYFAAIISGESVARPKPAPDVFLAAAEAIGVAPARCAVLEDSIAGVTAGRAAGMLVIAVPEGPPEGRGYEAVSDAIVPDLFAAWRVIQAARAGHPAG